MFDNINKVLQKVHAEPIQPIVITPHSTMSIEKRIEVLENELDIKKEEDHGEDN
jgi:hypothetical protein